MPESPARARIASSSASEPPSTSEIGRSRSVRSARRRRRVESCAPRPRNAAHDRRQRAHERDEARPPRRRPRRCRADTRCGSGPASCRAPAARRRAISGEVELGREDAGSRAPAPEREQPPAEHHQRDARADDVADAEQRRVRLEARASRRDRSASKRPARDLAPEARRRCRAALKSAPAPKPAEHGPRRRAAALADDQHLGAGGALGIRQASRARARSGRGAAGSSSARRAGRRAARPASRAEIELEAHQQQRRQREGDAGGDRLARRARRLHDVVLEDRRRRPKRAEQRDREHGDRDRRRDREADLERRGRRTTPRRRCRAPSRPRARAA